MPKEQQDICRFHGGYSRAGLHPAIGLPFSPPMCFSASALERVWITYNNDRCRFYVDGSVSTYARLRTWFTVGTRRHARDTVYTTPRMWPLGHRSLPCRASVNVVPLIGACLMFSADESRDIRFGDSFSFFSCESFQQRFHHIHITHYHWNHVLKQLESKSKLSEMKYSKNENRRVQSGSLTICLQNIRPHFISHTLNQNGWR